MSWSWGIRYHEVVIIIRRIDNTMRRIKCFTSSRVYVYLSVTCCCFCLSLQMCVRRRVRVIMSTLSFVLLSSFPISEPFAPSDEDSWTVQTRNVERVQKLVRHHLRLFTFSPLWLSPLFRSLWTVRSQVSKLFERGGKSLSSLLSCVAQRPLFFVRLPLSSSLVIYSLYSLPSFEEEREGHCSKRVSEMF